MKIDTVQKSAISHLKKVDPKLGVIIDQITLVPWKGEQDHYVSLVGEIISQQLSTRVADVIYERFEKLVGQAGMTPKRVLALYPQQIRDIGVSWGKVSYIRDLAERTQNGEIRFAEFPSLPDEEIIQELTKIKGIGQWTAEMFLIFHLGRPDVFSFGDLGLRRAVQKVYGLKKEPSLATLKRLSSPWKPYRSFASRYLWKSLEL